MSPRVPAAGVDKLDEWINAPPRKKRTRNQATWVAQVERETAVMRNTQDWSACKPEHLVAQYAWCHHRVYGVAPAELMEGSTFFGATSHTRAFVAQQFKSCEEAVDFVRWTWHREMPREQRARQQGTEPRRIGWRLQFSPALVTDYRLSLARRGEELP